MVIIPITKIRVQTKRPAVESGTSGAIYIRQIRFITAMDLIFSSNEGGYDVKMSCSLVEA